VPSAGHIIVVSDLAPIEMFSTFARLQRSGILSTSDVATLQSSFLLHFEKEYLSIALDVPALVQARRIVGNHPLRTLDAIQLACALSAVALLSEPMTFVSGDNNLLAAAAAEGFATDNPYAHP
jgi:predicted nucleic acid-binding protein